jgi:hypothetical protein
MSFSARTAHGEWIETYESIESAIEDMLLLWPEESTDVGILEDTSQEIRAYLRAVPGDPSLCDLIRIGEGSTRYKIEYVSIDGVLRTECTALGRPPGETLVEWLLSHGIDLAKLVETEVRPWCSPRPDRSQGS